MGAYLIDNPPRVRQYRNPRRQEPSGVVVNHTAEAFADETGPDRGAENVATFIKNRTNAGSYHDLVDSDSILSLIPFTMEAFHDATGSNPHSYGLSWACQASQWANYDDGWVESAITNGARAAARYADWLETRSGIVIPARRVTRAESERKKPGFISHAERDPARRTDPGRLFPWEDFLGQYSDLREGNGVIDMATPAELWGYKNPTFGESQAFTRLRAAESAATVAADRADYATKQLNSIGAGLSALAFALKNNNLITDAEQEAINAEISGKGLPGLSR